MLYFSSLLKTNPKYSSSAKTCFPHYPTAEKNLLFLTEQRIFGQGIICRLKQKAVNMYRFGRSRAILQAIHN